MLIQNLLPLLLLGTGADAYRKARFHRGASCTGDYVQKYINYYATCYKLGSGYARSIRSLALTDIEFLIGYKPSTNYPYCGTSVAVLDGYSSDVCASSTAKNIKGMELYCSCSRKRSEDNSTATNATAPQLGQASTCDNAVDVWAEDGEFMVEMPDGSFAPVPNLYGREPTYDEVAAAVTLANNGTALPYVVDRAMTFFSPEDEDE